LCGAGARGSGVKVALLMRGGAIAIGGTVIVPEQDIIEPQDKILHLLEDVLLIAKYKSA